MADKYKRNRVIELVGEIQEELMTHYSVNAPALARKLGIHQKTANRYLQMFERRYPIRISHESGPEGGRVVHYILDPQWRKRHRFL